MNKQPDWEQLTQRLERLMRLKSFPVAFKMLPTHKTLDEIPFMRRISHKMTLCQMITLVRNFDWTVGAEVENFFGSMCSSVLGLTDTPDFYKDGTFRSIVWVKTKEDGKKYEAAIPRLPLGKYEALAMAPLIYKPFDPDIVLIYANPAQIMLLINSLQFEKYEVMQFYCVGESSCSDAIARCYLTNKPSLSIPCYGERRYGHAQDDELVMAVPADMMEKALAGMESLFRRGIRYPISYAGAEENLAKSFPVSYGSMDELKLIRGNDHRLLLGVTGGIASGKTTVTNMLLELGAPLIDFDVLSREVVEPGKPAHNEIVAYFGAQILQEDGALDRKKLSQIVFRDIEKRKKLETFIHPRINEEFIKRLGEISAKNPLAIIQVAIPLLIELNLQYQFHKLLVVYIPEKEQIARLALRDGISVEEAANILKAQLPIDEKEGYADFVINNEGSVEETEQQVRELWQSLQKFQDDKHKP